MPRPLVALPCGSRSTSRTRFSATASEAARFTAVVVLPTPPFWFAIARTDPMSEPPHDGASVRRSRRTTQDRPRANAGVPRGTSDAFVDGDAPGRLRERQLVRELVLEDEILRRLGKRVVRAQHAEDEPGRKNVVLRQHQPFGRGCQ